MLTISTHIFINDDDVHINFIRSPGPGGQNVNKVASAVQLRFNVKTAKSLSDEVRALMLLQLGNRITQDGELIIKATRFRTQERNKQDALDRLTEILQKAAIKPKNRRKTKPTYASKQKRLDSKKKHSKTKSLRQNKDY